MQHPTPHTPHSVARPEERCRLSTSFTADQGPHQNGTGTVTQSSSKTKLLRGNVDLKVPSYGSLQTSGGLQPGRQSADEAFVSCVCIYMCMYILYYV